MVRYIILLTLLFLGSSTLFAQTTGSLQGKVIDVGNDEGLPFANVVLEKGGVQISGTQTDFDGNYNFSNVEAGTYDVLVSYVGFPTVKTEGVVIKLGQVVRFDIEMEEGQDLTFVDSTGKSQAIVVRAYRIPLIEQDATSGGQTLGAEDIKNLATRSVTSIVATTAGVSQADEGEAINSNGSRSSSNDTYIDGVRVIGNFGVPETEIDQVQIITSGVPAEFGDATGAITNIITKGPSSELSGGVQLETSQFLDAFGANRADAYFSGPIIAKPMLNALGDTLKKDGKIRKSTILGYRLAGVYSTTLDSRPSALGSFKLKEEKLDEILANPLIANPSGSGRVYAADFLTEDDFEMTAVRPNARTSSAMANGKLDFKPNKDYYFVVGGQAQFGWGNSASTGNRVFNYRYNPTFNNNTWRVSGRFRHTVSSTQPGGDEEGDSTTVQSVFQNFSYELQGDYSQTNSSSEDPRYKDRLWEYGYVGKFHRSLVPVIDEVDSVFITNSVGDTLGVNVVNGHAANYIRFDAYEPNLDINPGLAAYNNLIPKPFDSSDPSTFDPNAPTTIDQMEIINGLNTGNRTSIYGLFNAPHQLGTGYGKSNSSQVRANVKANFDLVMAQRSGNPIRHSIQMGGTFEQRITRAYNINPFSLWTLADQSANFHLDEEATDLTRPTGETYFDPRTQRQYQLYQPLIRTDDEGKEPEMTLFAQRLREELNLTKRDWVNVHEMTPDQMQLSWFEPTTLIQGRSAVMSYYGYDYLGNPTGADVDFFSFFTEEVELDNGKKVKTRPIAPAKPIYAAGYIQDKFTYKDIICNIGLRFDSYDANTKVLNDPYSIVGYETAAEFESNSSLYTAGKSSLYNRPDNIGDDFAVYVNGNNEDASVVGYRDGERWYNANGIEVNTPSELGSTILPALKGFGTAKTDPQGDDYDPTIAFRDYRPNVIVMPRIAFSFPISKEANFYANYDVLAQRPPSGAFASPLTYYNFRETTAGGGLVGNPNLRAQRTINYEVGFQQKLTDFSKFKLSLVYREERDLIQVRQYINAYPNTYSTYGNSDFSTTKSFKLEYDMRENKNLRVLANYTLAFSEGTGSSPTSSLGVAAKELKYVFPLSFDQTHTFYLMLDYRFKSGEKYNGPKIGKFDVLENTGLNLAFNANSGRPYTRKEIPGGIGTSFGDRITDGSINGARMPWSFRVDLKLDRDFVIGKNSKNPIRLNVYLRVQNLFNTQNPLGVYSVTGSPTDDGFLTTAAGQGPGHAASQPASYELLYNYRMNNPFNISRPRRIFLGLRFSF